MTATSGIVLTSAPINEAPAVTAQEGNQSSSPVLEQTIADAAANALSYVDTATYLSSLFKT
jgi:hypothetical protein